MNHTNLILPVVLILALCVGVCLCAVTARDVWDDIGVRTDRYRRHPLLAYVLFFGCFGMIVLVGRLLVSTVTFCLTQLLT